MKKSMIAAALAVFLFLLSGCGAHVSTTTGPNGTTLNRATVWSGTTLTYNPQTGLLCIDAASGNSCQQNTAK